MGRMEEMEVAQYKCQYMLTHCMMIWFKFTTMHFRENLIPTIEKRMYGK